MQGVYVGRARELVRVHSVVELSHHDPSVVDPVPDRRPKGATRFGDVADVECRHHRATQALEEEGPARFLGEGGPEHYGQEKQAEPSRGYTPSHPNPPS